MLNKAFSTLAVHKSFENTIALGLLPQTSALSATKLSAVPQYYDGAVPPNLISATNAQITEVYLTETGTLLGVIVQTNTAVVGVDGGGSLIKVLQRVAGTAEDNTVEYYNQGIDQGKLQRIGNVYLSYYNTANTRGKLQRLGDIILTYYNTPNQLGKAERIGNLYFGYQQWNTLGIAKLERIGNVYFDYDRKTNRISRTRGELPGVQLRITSVEQWRRILGLPGNFSPPQG